VYRQSNAAGNARAIAKQYRNPRCCIGRCHHALRDQRPQREQQCQEKHRRAVLAAKAQAGRDHDLVPNDSWLIQQGFA
jgi:hypothetical protein